MAAVYVPQAPWRIKGIPILLEVGHEAASGITLIESVTGERVVRTRTHLSVKP